MKVLRSSWEPLSRESHCSTTEQRLFCSMCFWWRCSLEKAKPVCTHTHTLLTPHNLLALHQRQSNTTPHFIFILPQPSTRIPSYTLIITPTALEIFLYFVKVALGGPAFGYLMAKITIFWLSHVFNDALVEITITLASTYITFYIGEGLFEVSGVLAVVTLGIELNSRRTSISPEVEAFLHR